MKIQYVDAHCHIQFDQYAKDDEALIEKMRERGVVGIVVGVDHESSEKAVALAQMHEHLYAAVGLHPNREKDERYEIDAYRSLALHPKVVAIGECGLDYFRPEIVDEETKRRQKRLLLDQIKLASTIGKPLIIHARPSKGTNDAYHDLIEIVKKAKAEHPALSGDIHFFVGGKEEGEAFIALGFTVSYTAVVTFARDYDPVIAALPLENILSETDAPYVAPASRRGERNDPLAVEEVVEAIASIRGEEKEAVRKALCENAYRLFGLPRG